MTLVESEARRRLATVDDLLDGPAAPAVAARASVWLLRLALERAVGDFWAVRISEVGEASMRVQLLVLPRYLPAEDAWRVKELWNVLSRVAHHHAYELTPTRAEVVRWRQDVERAVDAVEEARHRTIRRSASAADGSGQALGLQ